MSGFWKFANNYSSPVTKLLESDFSLDQLLDEQDLLSELLGSNSRLIEYLREPHVLEQLVELIVEDDDYQQEQVRLKFENEEDSDFETVAKPNLETIEQNPHRSEIESTEPENADVKPEEQADPVDPTEEEETTEAEINEKDPNETDSDSDSEYDSGELSKYDSSDDNDLNGDDNDLEDQEETAAEAHSRRAQVAAEILSADVWSITDEFMEKSALLDNLWTILDKPAPLPMFSATYFMKINEHLLDMKMDEMIQFILQQPQLVERFMRHIDTPPLMDFLLKVISTDKPDASTGVIDILQEQRLIPGLIDHLGPDIPSTVQSAAGDFLKAFITISANSNTDNTTIGPNELSRELVSEPMVRKLVAMMLNGGTGLSNAVGIVIEIIRKNNSDYDFVPVLYTTIESHPPTLRDPIYLGTLVKVFAEAIPDFTEMLGKKVQRILETPFGTIEPLGFERFKICELVAELLHCSNMALLNHEDGEPTVRERDTERDRLKALQKESLKDPSSPKSVASTDDEISRDIGNLSVAADTEVGEIISIDTENVVEGVEAESTGEQSVTDDEPSQDIIGDKIRGSPVVGDKLKIALYDSNVINVILNMFFKFPWNNFLHNVVFDIVQQILNGPMDLGYNRFLATDLFTRGAITQLIIDGQKRCDDYEEQTGLRLGYMGHLTLIAEEVVKFTTIYIDEASFSTVRDAVTLSTWQSYVYETLVQTREKYNSILGDTVVEQEAGDSEDDVGDSLIMEPENDDDDEEGESRREDEYYDYDDEEFQTVEHDDQAFGVAGDEYYSSGANEDGSHSDDDSGDKFSRYMSQQITNNFPDKFGSSDEDDDSEEESWRTLHAPPPPHPHASLGEEDDYEDPNDDGQSYAKKDHPLYKDEEEVSEDSEDEDAEDEASGQDLGLFRSTSKGDMNWDVDEQRRLISTANYIQHTASHDSPVESG
ncbi:unnamed protein product [Kuraishia capsulata CBS 1993]|uniref:SIT4 phosphatase-associated protein n=1 Tax=Kuraishia capsulata CBS 1993 TaxID=1382522 RepID=W6MHP8_9ASCO|nr:uncharacterized protein KUCA_T00001804001 [Kuraishia capsulata CBS 1993]CDK25834.1 unnamed protein product [Kuraishia capsulata CBS 1993]